MHLDVAVFTETSSIFCLDLGKEAFFLKLLRQRCAKQNQKRLIPRGDCKRCQWVGDVHCSHPAPERVPPCRSSSLWPASKRFAWWLLKGLVKKLQTSSQALQHRWGNRRKLFAFLYVMLHISPADSFQFVEEIYTAPQMVFFNLSSSHPKLKCLVLL